MSYIPCSCDDLVGASITEINIKALPLIKLLHKLLHGNRPHRLDPYWEPDDYYDTGVS